MILSSGIPTQQADTAVNMRSMCAHIVVSLVMCGDIASAAGVVCLFVAAGLNDPRVAMVVTLGHGCTLNSGALVWCAEGVAVARVPLAVCNCCVWSLACFSVPGIHTHQVGR